MYAGFDYIRLLTALVSLAFVLINIAAAIRVHDGTRRAFLISQSVALGWIFIANIGFGDCLSFAEREDARALAVLVVLFTGLGERIQAIGGTYD